MKKNLFLALILTIAISTNLVNAEGFSGNSTPTVKTVAEVLKMPDDSYVSIKGNIVKKISEEHYMFKDNTGTMTVEIEQDKWNGISANSKDLIVLTGEVEKKNNYVELDVDSVQKK